MKSEEIDAHIRRLGSRPTPKAIEITVSTFDAIERIKRGRLSHAARWFLATYGGKTISASYADPKYGADVMLGWIMDGSEIVEAAENFEELPADLVPFTNDGADHPLCLGIGTTNRDAVYFYEFASSKEERIYKVADSLEDFLLSLHHAAE